MFGWPEIETREPRWLGGFDYTAEFAATIRRRTGQQRLGREVLPEPESLAQVRRVRRLSQAEVAIRLASTQSEVSKLERRGDALISTLSDYIEAMGGTLDLIARFQGLAIRITLKPPSKAARP
jgi:hypothetical protein